VGKTNAPFGALGVQVNWGLLKRRVEKGIKGAKPKIQLNVENAHGKDGGNF